MSSIVFFTILFFHLTTAIEMERWIGKVALVTGAACGMGAAITQEFSKQGITVFAVDILQEKLDKLKVNIGQTDGDVIPVKCDVTKEEEVSSVFKLIKERFGAIHILVNAAGIGRKGLTIDAKIQFFRDVFDVNVLGLLICTQQAIKLMKESGVDDGQIIHIGSIAGQKVIFSPNPSLNVYAASKHAVKALTETLRVELISVKSKIRVSSISPGLCSTEFGYRAELNSELTVEPEDWRDKYKNAPLLQPEDIAKTAIFILSTPSHVQIHEIIIRPVGESF